VFLNLVDYATEIGVGTSLDEGNRVCYESVVRKRAITRGGGRFPEVGAVIHG
jgi:hypothetical protein